MPTPRKKYSFYIDAWQAEALKKNKPRDEMSESAQIRLALKKWLEKRGFFGPER